MHLDACRSRVNVFVSDVSAMPIESLCQATDTAATNRTPELHADKIPRTTDAASGEVGILPNVPLSKVAEPGSGVPAARGAITIFNTMMDELQITNYDHRSYDTIM